MHCQCAPSYEEAYTARHSFSVGKIWDQLWKNWGQADHVSRMTVEGEISAQPLETTICFV